MVHDFFDLPLVKRSHVTNRLSQRTTTRSSTLSANDEADPH